jgi:hypothetical protein
MATKVSYLVAFLINLLHFLNIRKDELHITSISKPTSAPLTLGTVYFHLGTDI